MPGLVGIFMMLGGLLMLVGLVLILIKAFKESFLWGLLVLLIPFLGALAFVANNWREAKNGFYVLFIGTMLALIAVYGGADKELELADKIAKVDSKVAEETGVSLKDIPQSDKVAELLEKRPTEVEVPNQAEAEAMGVDAKEDVFEEEALAELESVEIKPLSEPTGLVESPEIKVKVVKKSYQPISRSRLNDFLGAPIRIHMLDGDVEEGVLEKVSDTGDSVTVMQSAGAGEISYEYPFARIEWMEVLARVGTVPAPEDDVAVPGEVTPVFLPEGVEPSAGTPAEEPAPMTIEPVNPEPATQAPAAPQ